MRANKLLSVAVSVAVCWPTLDGALASAAASPPAAVVSTPIPHASGPIPVTPTSYPFNSVLYNRTPRTLAEDGYVEQEYFVSGSAAVYDWPEGQSVSAAASGPYETRIVVRRPARRASFSGNVIVEMLNPTSLHDLDIVWAAAQNHFIEDGDIWVGLTVKPSSIAALKTFDATRYAALSMSNPVAPRCSTTTWSGATPTTENGLVWDMVSQVGALLKSNSPSNPLAGLRVRAEYLTGYSQTAGYLTTYINAIAPHAMLADGRPIYDGHMVIAGANFPVPINQCAPAPARGSDRWVIQTPGQVPVIAIQTLSDFYPLSGFYSRRADSTGANGNYRLYEVAGAGHVWATQVAYAPGAAELVQSGFPATWWDPYCTQPLTTFPLEYAIDGAFANMYRWVRQGRPAPIADRIQVSDPTSPTAATIVDSFGNAVGGLRTPAVDVPVAAYFGTSTGTGTCGFLWGHQEPFSEAQLAALYPQDRDCAHAVEASAKSLQRQGWLTRDDAKTIIEAARHGVP